MSKDIRDSLAELIGTFILVFVGGFAVASGQGVVVAALAHGLILIGIIYQYGHISGAHVNPAVTAGLLVGGKISINKAVFYWVAQFIGAILAAVVLNIIVPGAAAAGQTIGSPENGLTFTAPWSAALFEAVLTFILVSTVYQAAVYGKVGNVAGIAIGFTLAGAILAGGTYTGASLNPARTLGPALIAGDLSYILPYFVGIFAGGILAGLLHTLIFPDRG